jgi:hypothetical protein
MRNGARLAQRLAHEQPPGAGLDRDMHLLASEPPRPIPDGLPRGPHPATLDLACLLIKSVEGDLRSVHVEPGYDRHWGLL